ncbi:MAG: hypothetical protein AAGI03_01180 [Pseudomonadota bacterium]
MSDFETLQREAAGHRERLTTSLSKLSETLEPAALKSSLGDLAEGYVGESGRQIVEVAKSKPVAFAFMGLGVALLAAGTSERPAPSQTSAPHLGGAEDALDGFDARLHAADAAMSERPRASSLRATIETGLEKLSPDARRRVLKARRLALDAQEKAEKHAKAATSATRDSFERNPLAVGALAIGAGALIGALLPRTRAEDRTLGASRDRLMQEAKAALAEELRAVRAEAHASTSNQAAGTYQNGSAA